VQELIGDAATCVTKVFQLYDSGLGKGFASTIFGENINATKSDCIGWVNVILRRMSHCDDVRLAYIPLEFVIMAFQHTVIRPNIQ